MVPASLSSLSLEVRSNPDNHSLVGVHSALRIIVDNLLLSSVSSDVHYDVSHSLTSIIGVVTVYIGSIVGLLEVLVEHLKGHLSHSLPGLEPFRDGFHLIVGAEPFKVDGLDGLSRVRKSFVGEVTAVSHGSLIEGPLFIIGTNLGGQVVGQHRIFQEGDLFSDGTGVYTVLDKRDVVSSRRVVKIDRSDVL